MANPSPKIAVETENRRLIAVDFEGNTYIGTVEATAGSMGGGADASRRDTTMSNYLVVQTMALSNTDKGYGEEARRLYKDQHGKEGLTRGKVHLPSPERSMRHDLAEKVQEVLDEGKS